MITIPIWLFVILVVLASLMALFIIAEIIIYCKAVKIERDYHNKHE